MEEQGKNGSGGEGRPITARELLTPIYNRMTTMFYLMMRDHVSVGAVNQMVKSSMTPKETSFSDELLRAKAESLAGQLVEGEYQVTEIDAMWSVRRGGEGASGVNFPPEVMSKLRSIFQGVRDKRAEQGPGQPGGQRAPLTAEAFASKGSGPSAKVGSTPVSKDVFGDRSD